VISGLGPPAVAVVLGGGLASRMAGVVVEVLPGVWRYARLAGGDSGAWLHAVSWAVGGVAAAALVLARRTRR